MLRGRTKTLCRLASRVIVGTGIYLVIVLLAAPLPAAAGSMLTFPALNGLAFFFSEDERAVSIARTMFWMPIVNGAFCATYIALFLLSAETLSPPVVAWGLLLVVAVLWLAWVSRSHVRAGIDPSGQLMFAIAATLAGILLTAATMLIMARLGIAAPRPAFASNPTDLGWIADAVGRNGIKIGLFALTLAVFVSAVAYFPISDSTRGILAGLPIVPFAGLVSTAADGSLGADARVQVFLGMIGGVWLGPPIAMWFVYCFSRYLGARRKARTRRADTLWRFAALLTAWLLTFAAMVTVGYAISSLSGRS
jgi:hypothetical protein